MHLEILVEEPSVRKVLDNILPRLITGEHSYKVITHQGKTDLLKKLPGVLKGYSKWINQNMRIIVLIDRDKDDCLDLKNRLDELAYKAKLIPKSKTVRKNSFNILNRIAIEELESWFFGDVEAIRSAFPKVPDIIKKEKYRDPDLIIDTWETLEALLQKYGYFRSGYRKIEAAYLISNHMAPLKNRSNSFNVFWRGIAECLK